MDVFTFYNDSFCNVTIVWSNDAETIILNLVYKNGEVLPDVTPVIEDEPLIIEGEEFIIEGEELLARAILHENDHLDGHMYVEKVEGELVNNEDLAAENEDA